MQDYEYLIHLLYSFITETQPMEKPDEVSFENVFNLSTAHGVGNIAYLSVEKLNNKPDEDILNAWMINYYLSVERDAKQVEAYDEMLTALHENGIRTVEAQGTVTKTLYPEPYLRLMSDIDLIVDLENAEKTAQVMQAHGYKMEILQVDEFNAENEEGMKFDFHCDFFPEKMHNRKEPYSDAISDPFAHAKPDPDDEYKYVLDDTYYYLYSVLHTFKHFEIKGCGIRRILDFYYLKKAFENKIDNAFVKKVIDKNGFTEVYNTLFEVEKFWFEGREPEFDISSAVNDLIVSGDDGNEEIFIRNNLRKDREEGVRFPKLHKIMTFIFPSREYIYLGYPEISDKNYSLFRCRMYRIVKTIKKFRFKHIVSYVKLVFKS